MTVKIKHNKAHVLYKALGYDHCNCSILMDFSNDLLCSRLLAIERNDAITREITIATRAKC